MKRAVILCICLICTIGCYAQLAESHPDLPDSIQIGVLQNIFEPVHFAHKLHADMTSMGAGCNTCHHHAFENVYKPCSECHPPDSQDASLAIPTLNGAYHRNCLNCHRDWNSNRVCTTCHTERKAHLNPRKALDATDVLAHTHEEIIIPVLFHFVSPENEQKPVVFHHQEHVDLYRYKCEHCHRQSNCTKCHNYIPSPTEKVSQLAVHHNPCSNCHDTETDTNCAHCHTGNPPLGFTHERTGWELKAYHQELRCEQCHKGDEPIKRLDANCKACHSNFEVGEFDHNATKLTLNVDHIEIDCYECHIDNRYDIKPSCVECHEDEITFPADLPGEFKSN
ncbi:hypothetical protein HQ531_01810 [bacterium]|nr:hypothetical protein [bacterium]